MKKQEDKEVNYLYRTPKGVRLRSGSYWAWKEAGSTTTYFRLITVQNSAGGGYAVVRTAVVERAGMQLLMFEQDYVREITDESEIGIAALQLL